MASIGILVFLIVVLVQVLSAAVYRLIQGGTPRVFPEGIGIMAATMVVNLVRRVLRAARRATPEERSAAGRRQAHPERRADVGGRADRARGRLVGVPLLDPLAAFVVAGFIGHACWSIARDASRILADQRVIAEAEVRTVVQGVPGVIGCEKIRTRGSADHAFLDLHLWLDPLTPLQSAHATSHLVKDRLMASFPQLADVVIHIEPPPPGG
jgi:divalent metal cation (Fe/Co/Zn/Cd) transporter